MLAVGFLHFCTIKKQSLLYVVPSDPHTGSKTSGQISGHSPMVVVGTIMSVYLLPRVVVSMTVAPVFCSVKNQYVQVFSFYYRTKGIKNSSHFFVMTVGSLYYLENIGFNVRRSYGFFLNYSRLWRLKREGKESA